MNEASPIQVDASESADSAFIPLSRDDVINELTSDKFWTNPDERSRVVS